MSEIRIGYSVVFKDHVFGKNSPMYPYYEKYRGHIFEVETEPHDGHVGLRCVSDCAVIVDGHVHTCDLRLVSEPAGLFGV